MGSGSAGIAVSIDGAHGMTEYERQVIRDMTLEEFARKVNDVSES